MDAACCHNEKLMEEAFGDIQETVTERYNMKIYENVTILVMNNEVFCRIS